MSKMAEGGVREDPANEFMLDSDSEEEAIVQYLRDGEYEEGDHFDDGEDDDSDSDNVPLAAVDWTNPPNPMRRPQALPQMSEKPQVTGEDLEQKSPIDFFDAMFPPVLYEQIATEINCYAASVLQDKVLGPKSRLRSWKDTDVNEVKAFLALRIAMGLCSKPSLEDYWNQWWMTSTPSFGKVITRNRFKLLSSFLHFVDNSQRIERGNPGYNPLFKIQPVLSEVLPAWENNFVLGKHISIDESMIGYRRFGVKAFVFSDSKNNYIYRWDIYTGSAYNYDRNIGQGHSVVNKLTMGLPAGHVLYTDSFYTSPGLCKDLYERGIGLCGTVQPNRKGMPPQLKEKNLKLKEDDRPVFVYKSPVLACAFYDRKTVRFLTTVHNQDIAQQEVTVPASKLHKYPSGKRTFFQPALVGDYNKYMRGWIGVTRWLVTTPSPTDVPNGTQECSIT